MSFDAFNLIVTQYISYQDSKSWFMMLMQILGINCWHYCYLEMAV
jgi:hypothetical protein